MAETEVESILREIRERVLSEQSAASDGATIRSAMTSGGNGASESDSLKQILTSDNESLTTENLSLIESYLTTTGRAWGRLPPLVSNRSGLIARVELWLKRQLKRATHWYTWEQVNFNAAVHRALSDLLPVLAAHETQLRQQRDAAEARLAELTAQLTALQVELTALQVEVDRHEAQVGAGLVGLKDELRQRDERLQEEQRVCFKQLALETSEAAVLEDRARRKSNALLEELQRRVDGLEKDEA